MDPLSALGVAAGVVQLIDFGTRLTSAAGQLYLSPSGRTAEEVELTTIASDLSQFSANINSKTARLARYAPAESASEATLFAICEECVAAAKELEDAIRKLRPKGRNPFFIFRRIEGCSDERSELGSRTENSKIVKATHSFYTAIRSIASFNVKRWRVVLLDLRTRMMTALLAVLW
jgi:hypothetical protein